MDAFRQEVMKKIASVRSNLRVEYSSANAQAGAWNFINPVFFSLIDVAQKFL